MFIINNENYHEFFFCSDVIDGVSGLSVFVIGLTKGLKEELKLFLNEEFIPGLKLEISEGLKEELNAGLDLLLVAGLKEELKVDVAVGLTDGLKDD
jgi:uncharacterized protein (UPF0254 family)